MQSLLNAIESLPEELQKKIKDDVRFNTLVDSLPSLFTKVVESYRLLDEMHKLTLEIDDRVNYNCYDCGVVKDEHKVKAEELKKRFIECGKQYDVVTKKITKEIIVLLPVDVFNRLLYFVEKRKLQHKLGHNLIENFEKYCNCERA